MIRRFWNRLFYRPFVTSDGKHFRTEKALSRHIWKEALRP